MPHCIAVCVPAPGALAAAHDRARMGERGGLQLPQWGSRFLAHFQTEN